MLEGGCFCRFVRYRADSAPVHETNCHCTMCQRASGAPFVAWFTVERSAFEFSSGEPTVFDSSSHAQRTHCPRCGSSLTFATSREPELIDITIASLDYPNEVVPRDHVHAGSKLSWVSVDDLPCHRRERS